MNARAIDKTLSEISRGRGSIALINLHIDAMESVLRSDAAHQDAAK
jgi:hypothetical protein